MSKYGVTDKGFVPKRMDAILEEIHGDLSKGFGFDTRTIGTSFLDTLITSFGGQIADLWETAQDSYYAKYPATADGVNLDNSVQYGGIRRTPAKRTLYPLHCTGDDGTKVRKGAVVATDTLPEIRLTSANDFVITRSKFNSAVIRIVSTENNAIYTVGIDGVQYSYKNKDGLCIDILNGIAGLINDDGYTVNVSDSDEVLTITAKEKYKSGVLFLSENLTTKKVTTIANYFTQDYGKIVLPYGSIKKLVNNIPGLDSVSNQLEPVYGRLRETDIELRQSYLLKSAIRSNTMVDSIVAELRANVPNVKSASGYENDTDVVDNRGLPPHSVELVVDGGDDADIANAILRRKAGGIQTHGAIVIDVPGMYGDIIPIRFNRPEYLYVWIQIALHGDKAIIPKDYAAITKQVLTEFGTGINTGDDLLVQMLTNGIYEAVAGITYIDIKLAYSADKQAVPDPESYKAANVVASMRQKILIDERRIEVSLSEDG